MGNAAKIEPQTVCAAKSGHWGPSAGGEEAEPGKESMILFRLGFTQVQAWNDNPRLCNRHCRVEAERPSGGTGGGDLHSIADAVGGDQGKHAKPVRVERSWASRLRWKRTGLGSFIAPSSAERHLGRLRTPPQFLDERALVSG
jgi:hypothetical protein